MKQGSLRNFNDIKENDHITVNGGYSSSEVQDNHYFDGSVCTNDFSNEKPYNNTKRLLVLVITAFSVIVIFLVGIIIFLLKKNQYAGDVIANDQYDTTAEISITSDADSTAVVNVENTTFEANTKAADEKPWEIGTIGSATKGDEKPWKIMATPNFSKDLKHIQYSCKVTDGPGGEFLFVSAEVIVTDVDGNDFSETEDLGCTVLGGRVYYNLYAEYQKSFRQCTVVANFVNTETGELLGSSKLRFQ